MIVKSVRGHSILVSDQDSDFSRIRIYPRLRRKYLELNIKFRGQTRSMARVIMERALGRSLRSNEFVDHIDRNTLNNQRCNLRVCSAAENNRNVAKRSVACTSIMKGVRFSKGAWISEISANKRRFYLGRYETECEAAAAYNGAAVVLHKEFAVLNSQ